MESAMKSVFSNEQLVELILEFSAAGMEWKDGLKLRRVCKLWKNNSFKGLALCKRRPWVKLPKDMDDFQTVFSQACRLPLQLKVSRHIDTAAISFIEENSKSITNVEICVCCVVPTDRTFQLVNVRTLNVHLTDEFSFSEFHELVKLLSRFVDRARHLKRFSLTIDTYEDLPVGIKFPLRVTHVRINTKNLDVPLTSLMNIHLKHLVDLSILSIDSRAADIEKLNQVFDKYGKQLNSSALVLASFRSNSSALKLPSISSLKELHIKPFLGISIEGLTGNFFLAFKNLTSLSLGFVNWLSLVKPETTIEHLKVLCVYGGLEEATSQHLETLESLGYFDLPKLEHLECKYFTAKTLRCFAARFFQKSKNLRTLLLNAFFYEPFQLTSIFTQQVTGIAILRETKWPQFAVSLKLFVELEFLETLSLGNDAPNYKYDIEPYLFRCAFLQMPNLRKINVTKNMTVRKTLAKDWKKEGRKLYLI